MQQYFLIQTNLIPTQQSAGGVRGVLYMCIYHITCVICTQYIFNGEAGKKESREGELESSHSLSEGRGREGRGEKGERREGRGREERGEKGERGRGLTMRVTECRRSHLGSGSR